MTLCPASSVDSPDNKNLLPINDESKRLNARFPLFAVRSCAHRSRHGFERDICTRERRENGGSVREIRGDYGYTWRFLFAGRSRSGPTGRDALRGQELLEHRSGGSLWVRHGLDDDLVILCEEGPASVKGGAKCTFFLVHITRLAT